MWFPFFYFYSSFPSLLIIFPFLYSVTLSPIYFPVFLDNNKVEAG